MIEFSTCKINLGLYVTGKRSDGFHSIHSVFYPIDWTDSIEVEKHHSFEIVIYGNKIECAPTDNLCFKAFQLLKKHYGIPETRIHLLKNIPSGAGLGGGSSNAAFTLKLLNRFYQLNISETDLANYAAQLGSDCPFFIYNQPMLVEGRGEILKKINLDLSNYYILLINPGIHISTAKAYSMIQPKEINFNLENRLINEPIANWKNFLVNDFELPITSEFPLIAEIKNGLIDKGAVYSSMSGSGSTVYGIFEKYELARKAQDTFSEYPNHLNLSANHLLTFL